MTRKVIQIFVTPETNNIYADLFALCDDGTIWSADIDSDHVWKQIPGVPQDNKADPLMPSPNTIPVM